MIEGIDISKYQGLIDQPTWRRLKETGQDVAVVGSWHGIDANSYAEANLLRAKSVGFTVATYMALNGSRNGGDAIRLGKAACGSAWDDVAFVGIDCEIDGILRITIFEAITECERLGKAYCIYTANWWWTRPTGMNNFAGFSDVPLWSAFYDGDPDIDFPTAPYGGWTLDDVVMEQFTGSSQLLDVTVDRNTIREDWWATEDEDAMTPDERRRLEAAEKTIARINALITAGGIFVTIGGKSLQGEKASQEDIAQAKALLALAP